MLRAGAEKRQCFKNDLFLLKGRIQIFSAAKENYFIDKYKQ